MEVLIERARMMKKEKKVHVEITPPNIQTAEFKLTGTAPYVQNKFSNKALQKLREAMEAGSTARKGKKKEPRDFKTDYEGAKHVSREGWIGIPAPCFRNAMVSACRLVGFHMTKAKLSVFVAADGYDADDDTPLVKISKGKPTPRIHPVRNATGVVDLRCRPVWREGWEAKVRVEFDADQFTLQDVSNLMMRVGRQVGVGEGRHDSKNSCGMGWGTFSIERTKSR